MSQEQLIEEEVQTEVVAKAKRRKYSAEYKLHILREVEACKSPGEVGVLLRREGLYSSLLSQRRGPKVDTQAKELARLQRENQRLQEKLERAELINEEGVRHYVLS